MAYASLGQSAATAPERRYWIPGGDLGTIATLLQMRAHAIMGATHPLVQARAQQIAGRSRDVATIADNLRAYLATHSRFTPDPDDIELIRTPLEQLRMIDTYGTMPGDCDDVATLGATLAKAVGLRARLVVLGFTGGATASFRHVFTEARTPSGWRDFDVTRTPTSARPQRVAVMEV